MEEDPYSVLCMETGKINVETKNRIGSANG